jgi:hypothetical protein
MQLLTSVINLLVPIPYFLPTLQNLVEKFLDTSENYGNVVDDLFKLESQLIVLTIRLSCIAHPHDPLDQTRACASWNGPGGCPRSRRSWSQGICQSDQREDVDDDRR